MKLTMFAFLLAVTLIEFTEVAQGNSLNFPHKFGKRSYGVGRGLPSNDMAPGAPMLRAPAEGRPANMPFEYDMKNEHEKSQMNILLIEDIKREIVNEQIKSAALMADLNRFERELSAIPMAKTEISKQRSLTAEDKTAKEEKQKTVLIIEQIKKQLLNSQIRKEALQTELAQFERDVMSKSLTEVVKKDSLQN